LSPMLSFTPATAGALFAAISLYGPNSANLGVWTLQPTAASQKYLPPPGFQAWDGGPVTPAASSVWSSSDAAANGMTLSNGGLTVNVTAASLHNAWQILRASTSQTSGKLYVEFSTSTGMTTTLHAGWASAGVNINSYLGDSNYSLGFNPIAGAAFVGAGFAAGNPDAVGAAANDVFAFAINFATGNIWLAHNNVWMGGGVPGGEVNPTAGTGPLATFTPATVGALFPAMAFSTSGSNGTWTLQSTAASQKYAPPSGFVAWDSAAPAVTGHRYWRLNMTATTGSAYAMAEVQFRTTAGTPLLFSGGTASASTIYGAGYEADKATDNNPTTMWISSLAKLASQTWTYDYGAGVTKAIVEIMIQARSDVPQGPDTFTPQWSDDGTTWTSMTPITTTWAAGQIQVFPVTPATHSSQALAYLARTVGGDEGGNGANIATLIDGLVSDGVWAKLDALYILAQQNQSDALLNLIGTSYGLAINNALAASDPRISNVVFTSYKGFSGFSPGAGFLDTGLNAVMASGLHYTQNSASFGAWSYATTSDQNAIMGTGSVTQIFDNYAGSVFYARTNNASVSSVPTSITKGLFVGDRPDASNVFPYQNGVSAGAIGAASQAMDNSNFWIGGAVGQGVTAQTLSAAFIGASLGAAGQLALYNRLRTYMTSIGVP
jgi:hypothetical protein